MRVPDADLSTPEGVLRAMTESAAMGLMERYRAFKALAADFPDTPHLADVALAMEVAALALVEANDIQHGRVPLTRRLAA